MKRPILFPLTLMLILTMLISGCTLRKPVATHGVAYNRAVERSENEVLLLNIVRSMKRHPQHYTAITQVRGTATNGLSPSLNLTLKNGEGASSTSGLGGSFSQGTSLVDVAVLNDKEFTNGILNPVSLEQTEYFLEQGWPEGFLGMLLIRKIEILNDDLTVPCSTPEPAFLAKLQDEACPKPDKAGETVYVNDPDESANDPFRSVKCFGARLWRMRVCENLRIANIESEIPVTLPTNGQESSEFFELLSKADKIGWRLKQSDDGAYTIGRNLNRVIKWKDGDVVTSSSPESGEYEKARQKAKKIAKFHFRSPEGVLYYLGEIMRAQAAVLGENACPREESLAELEPKIYSLREPGEDPTLLFVGVKKTCRGDKDPLVSVEHRGSKYVIPSLPSCNEGQVVNQKGCHRSMQVLAIVKQLIGLNKSRESLPTTGVVTATGG